MTEDGSPMTNDRGHPLAAFPGFLHPAMNGEPGTKDRNLGGR